MRYSAHWSALLPRHVRHLAVSVVKKNLSATLAELRSLSESHGAEARAVIVRTLCEALRQLDAQTAREQPARAQLLAQFLPHTLQFPNFTTTLCVGFRSAARELVAAAAGASSDAPGPSLIDAIAGVLRLPLAQQVALAAAFAQSDDAEGVDGAMRADGLAFLASSLREFADGKESLPLHVVHTVASVAQSIDAIDARVVRALTARFAAHDTDLALSPFGLDGPRAIVNCAWQYEEERDRASTADEGALLSTRLRHACGLAELMEDLGPACCASHASLREVVQQYPHLREVDVAHIIAMIVRSVGVPGPELQWNFDVFVDVIREMVPRISWAQTFASLDLPDFVVPSAAAFETLIRMFRRTSKDAFPVHAFMRPWEHTTGLVSFIKHAVMAPADVFSFVPMQSRLLDMTGVKIAQATPQIQNWLNLDLTALLLQLGETPHFHSVLSIFDHPLKACPDVILLSLASLPDLANSPLVPELLAAVLAPHLATSAASVVLHRAWALSPELIVRGMVDAHRRDPSAAALARILDVAQELKALPVVLESDSFLFALDLAALAGRREFLNLDRWLQEHISEYRDEFVSAALSFLRAKLVEPALQAQLALSTIALPHDLALVFFRCLLHHRNSMSTPVQSALKALFDECQTVVPKLSSVAETPIALEEFQPDVEDEANSLFHMVYSGAVTIDELIGKLQRYMTSANQRDQQLYACMIRNLFNECRHFHKFPEKELRITAVLFGSLIQHQLVTSMWLGVALRYVLDSLKKPAASKMFKFGIAALDQFKSRLPEWPQYCSHLEKITHLADDPWATDVLIVVHQVTSSQSSTAAATPFPAGTSSPPSVAAAAAAAAVAVVSQPQVITVAPGFMPSPAPPSSSAASTSSAPPPSSSPGVGMALNDTANVHYPTPEEAAQAQQARVLQAPQPQRVGDAQHGRIEASGFATTLNIDTLYAASVGDYAVPDQGAIDRIHFIFNNIAQKNLEQKVDELRLIIAPRYLRYLANFLVVKRVSLEANLHPLYVQLAELLREPAFFYDLQEATYETVRSLLRDNKVVTVAAERTLLKNLGAWLGLITIARNRPVLQRDLDLRLLIYHAYCTGRLVAVVPFVCKVLDACRSSRVLTPPNPWIMSLLALLCELYNLPDLKLNLKFEVLALCRTLGIEIRDIKPSTVLVTLPVRKDDNPDFAVRRDTPSAGPPPIVPPVITPNPQPGPSTEPPKDPYHVATLRPHVTIPSAELLLLPQFAHVKHFVAPSIESAVLEIVTPIVDRAVTIACLSARALVLKDFALEQNEQTILHAGQASARSLAGSLALVTCKEPLRLSITNHLRKACLEHGVPEAMSAQIDQLTQAVVAENLDLCCTFVEQAAVDRATEQMLEVIGTPLRQRRLAAIAAQDAKQPLQLPKHFTAWFTDEVFPPNVPPQLLAMRQLTPAQHALYDAFDSYLRAQPRQPGAAGFAADPSAVTGAAGAARRPDSDPTLLKLQSLVSRLDHIVSSVNMHVQQLAQSSEVVEALTEIQVVIHSLVPPSEVPYQFCMFLCHKLAVAPTVVFCHVYAAVFNLLKEVSTSLPSDLTRWFRSSAEPDPRFAEIAAVLAGGHLLVLRELDSLYAQRLEEARNGPWLDHFLTLLPRLLADERVNTRGDLSASIDALVKIQHDVESPERASVLRSLLERLGLSSSADVWPAPDAAMLERRIPPSLLQRFATTPASLQAAFFAEQVMPYLHNDQNVVQLFTSELETALRAYDDFGLEGLYAYIQLVMVAFNQSSSATAKLALLQIVLSVIRRALLGRAAHAPLRLQSPAFFFLLSQLLCHFAAPEFLANAVEGIDQNVLSYFGRLFIDINPSFVPSFCFAWMQLISHRAFMPRLLTVNRQKGAPVLQDLLVQLLCFMEPHIKGISVNRTMQLFYKGVLRILLVLLHDFPEFLCEYHFSLCDAVPTSCIQLRNLILSVFPHKMHLPDPFTPNLKVDLLPEIKQLPRIGSQYTRAITNNDLRRDIDTFFESRTPADFLATLLPRLMLPASEAEKRGTRYDVPVINALVLHVTTQAISLLESKIPCEVFQHLAESLDAEGRYYFLNAVANHLRYPNAQTHFFSWVLLYLFAECKQEIVREQITRVLLERLIVNRPHPWGLLITFIELIKNPRYSFWNHEFTRCAPEIEKLFSHVSRTIRTQPPGSMQPPQQQPPQPPPSDS